MDFKDIFKSFFGSNDDFFDNNSHFSHDFESEMNRDFEDISRSFGQMFEIFNNFSFFNDLNDSNKWQEIQPKSARDLMLKSDDELRQDLDYDQRVREKGLNSIFNEKPNYESIVSRSPTGSAVETKSFTKSYFYSSVNNNGRFEEQTTTKDSFGNTETSVTQRIGDKVLTKIIKKDKNNQILETNEMVSNLDQNDLNDFKRQFSPIGVQKPIDSPIVRPKVGFEDNSNNNSFVKRLFDFFK